MRLSAPNTLFQRINNLSGSKLFIFSSSQEACHSLAFRPEVSR